MGQDSQKVLGVDIGNVIINHRGIEMTDELFENGYHTIPAMESVVDSLIQLKSLFGNNIYLVSKCKVTADPKILSWLKKNSFFEQTGIPRDHVFFCRERSEKERICKQLNITHFIDDRLEVLSHLVGTVPNLYLMQPNEAEIKKFKKFLANVKVVRSWEEVLNALEL